MTIYNHLEKHIENIINREKKMIQKNKGIILGNTNLKNSSSTNTGDPKDHNQITSIS